MTLEPLHAGQIVTGIILLVQVGFQLYNLFKGPDVPDQKRTIEGSRIEDEKLTISTLGTPKTIVYGTARLAGNIFWAGDLIERETTTITETDIDGGKGGGSGTATTTQIQYLYFRSFAVAFGASGSTSARLLKVFLDGKLVWSAVGKNKARKSGVLLRWYPGTETQQPDPLLQSEIGVDDTPAFRGTPYIVFEDLPLLDYGNRTPNVTAIWAFEGSDDFPIESKTLTTGGSEVWHIDHDRNAVFYFAQSGAGNPLRVKKWSLDTSNTVTEVNNTLATGDLMATGNGQLFDGLAQDAAGFFYLAGENATKGRIFKIDPNSLQVVKTYSLSVFSGNTRCRGLVYYSNPSWPAGSQEWILIGLESGGIAWLNTFLSGGTLTEPYAPIHSGATTSIILDGFVDAFGEIILVVGPTGTGSATRRDLVKSTGFALGVRIDSSILIAEPITGWSVYDPTAEISAARVLVPVPHEDAMLVFNDTADVSQDLPLGEGIAKYDILTWPPTLLDSLSTFSDGIVTDALEHHHGLAIYTGQIVFEGSGSNTIYRVDVSDMSLVTSYSGTDWGFAGLGQAGIYDPLYNSWFLRGTSQFHRLYLDRNTGTGIGLDEVVTDLCDRAGIDTATELDVSDLTVAADSRNLVRGYRVSRRGSVTTSIQELMKGFLFDVCESDFKLLCRRRAGSAVDTGLQIPESDLGAGIDAAGEVYVEEPRVQDQEIPRRYDVRFLNPDIDYQEDSATAQRILTPTVTVRSTSDQTVDLPIVMQKDEAAQLAERILYMQWTERQVLKGATLPKWLRLDPTDLVEVSANGAVSKVRLTEVEIGAALGVSFEGIVVDQETFVSTGSAGQTADGVPSQTIDALAGAALYVMDIPLLRDTDDGTGTSLPLYVTVRGLASTWPGGVIYSSDNGQGWTQVGALTVDAAHGVATTALGSPSSWTTWDRTNTVTVALAHSGLSLSSITEEEVLRGGNAALLGQELIQFANVTDNGDGTWTLDTLLRGRRGTEDKIDSHNAGDLFVLLTPTTVQRATRTIADLGSVRYYRGVTFGAPLDLAATRAVNITGQSLVPYAPAYVDAIRDSSNDVHVYWTRRSRVGGEIEWTTAGQTPVGETDERYEVDLLDASDGSVSVTKSIATDDVTSDTGSHVVTPNTPSSGIARIRNTSITWGNEGVAGGDLVLCKHFEEEGNRGVFLVDSVSGNDLFIVNAAAVLESSGTGTIVVKMAEQVEITDAEVTAAGYSSGASVDIVVRQLSLEVGDGKETAATV